jgi:hypothetical protein
MSISLDNAIRNSKKNPFVLIVFLIMLVLMIYLIYMLIFKNTKTVVKDGVEKKESQIGKIIVALVFGCIPMYLAFYVLFSS